MKKFFQAVTAIKERAALCYTAGMCFYIFFLFVFKQESASVSMLFSLLLVGVAAGTMQIVAFSGLFIKKLSYGWRMVVFVVPFFAVMTALAVGFGWLPTESVKAWLIFAAIFIVIFLFITAGIGLYYRLSGRKYDDWLERYHQNKGES